MAARVGKVNRSLTSVGDAASALAIVLAVLALPLAINSWREERPSVRVSALCLAMGALLWSLVVV
jgi:hypothetical protein